MDERGRPLKSSVSPLFTIVQRKDKLSTHMHNLLVVYVTVTW